MERTAARSGGVQARGRDCNRTTLITFVLGRCEGTPVVRLLPVLLALGLGIGCTEPASADPWKDENGKDRRRGGYERSDEHRE
jgi:hypothetical protein